MNLTTSYRAIFFMFYLFIFIPFFLSSLFDFMTLFDGGWIHRPFTGIVIISKRSFQKTWRTRWKTKESSVTCEESPRISMRVELTLTVS